MTAPAATPRRPLAWRHAAWLPVALLCASLPYEISTAAAAQARPFDTAVVLDSTPIPALFQGVEIAELSGLAYDRDEGLLYAVSDRGVLFHFRLAMPRRRIGALRATHAMRLQQPLYAGSTTRYENAEGLTLAGADNGVRGDTELLVAFEDGPAVVRYAPAGAYLGTLPLQAPLAERTSYHSNKKRIEAITLAAEGGLILAPERPLGGSDQALNLVYDPSGGRWRFNRQPGTAIKAIERLEDNRLLVLERLELANGSPAPRLRIVSPGECQSESCSEGVIPFRSGPPPVANYEGMTLVAPDLVLLVADNGSDCRNPGTLALVRLESQRLAHSR